MSIEHDAWLREALRHAPDAQIEPPASLSEAILREARAKVRDAPARTTRPTSWWRWLTRPQVAVGFASLMVAVLVGLMWREGPPEEPAPMALPSAPVPAAPVATPPPAPEVRAEAKTAPALKPKAAAPRQRVAPEAAPPAPTPAPPALAAAPAPQAQRRAATLAQERADNVPSAMAGALADARSASPIESLRRTIASEPQRWTWQRDGGEVQPWNDAIAAWMAQLDAATAAGWQAAAAPDRAPLAELRLLRDGQLLHTWRIDSDGVRWNANRTAALSPATLDALRASLAQAAR